MKKNYYSKSIRKEEVKLLVLLGESASGKSTIEEILNDNYGYKKIVSYTTRQAREREINGKDYLFLDEDNFNELKRAGSFIMTACYNGWKYGIPISQCVDNAVLVTTPYGLRQLKKNENFNIISIYIKVPRRDRLIKVFQRGDNIEEAYRRNLSDVGKYDGIEDEVDFVIENVGYEISPDEIAKTIIERITHGKV